MATNLQAGFKFFFSCLTLVGSFARSFSVFPNSFQIPNHTEHDCPLTIISCPYEKMGCESKVSTPSFRERKHRSVRDNAERYST